MTAASGTWGRMFALELRRSAAWWMLAPLAGFAWLLLRAGGAYTPVVTWLSNSANIGWTACMVAPLLAGFAAWQAGRDRRCGLDDLLATVPQSRLTRASARLLPVLLAGVAGWLLAAVVAIGTNHPARAWGEPRLDFLLLGLAVLLALGCGGYAVGLLTQARLVPPALVLGCFSWVAIGGVGEPGMLAPQAFLEPLRFDVFHRYAQTPAIGMALVWLGGSLLLLALSVWWLGRTTPARAPALLSAGALAVLLIGGTLVTRPAPANGLEPLASWTPTCTAASVPICVHPAFSSVLPELVAQLDPMLAAVAGAPGAPTRVQQVVNGGLNVLPDGTLPLSQNLYPNDLVMLVALRLTVDVDRTPATDWPGIAAQIAIATGLTRLTDADLAGRWFPHPYVYDAAVFDALMPTIDTTARRFAALDDATRRAWLHANLAALRVGDLTLEDLP